MTEVCQQPVHYVVLKWPGHKAWQEGPLGLDLLSGPGS